jgi:hypothetical protein
MKAVFEKYKSHVYNILPDLVCLFGVMLFSWSILNIMLFYWLDIALMVIFIAAYMKKFNKAPFNPAMIGAVVMMLLFIGFLYPLIVFFGKSMGYEAEEGFMMALQPSFMIPVYLVTTFVNNYNEFRFYAAALEDKKADHYLYPKQWAVRLFGIELVLFTGMSVNVSPLLALLMVAALKFIILRMAGKPRKSSSRYKRLST